MDLKKAIYEHLKTRRKYNTLLLKYEVAKEDLEKKINELNTEKRIHLKRQEIWEQKLKEQEEEIIKLKKKGVNKNVSKPKVRSPKVVRKAQNNK